MVEAAETRFGDVRPVFRHDLTTAEKNRLIGEYLCTLPYNDRLTCCLRPEECDESLHEGIWDDRIWRSSQGTTRISQVGSADGRIGIIFSIQDNCICFPLSKLLIFLVGRVGLEPTTN